MKGQIPTPRDLADHMVSYLFNDAPPSHSDRILFPGVGTGPFVRAIQSYCNNRNLEFPRAVAIDSDCTVLEDTKSKFNHLPIDFIAGDFLDPILGHQTFDYIIGNPPYVPIEKIDKKQQYREDYECASGRFDLYLLFFEKSLNHLASGGRLIFVTPQKFESVEAGEPLRRILGSYHVRRFEQLDEDQFDGRITYPVITEVHDTSLGETTVINRDGSRFSATLPKDGERWASTVRDIEVSLEKSETTLGDITERISPGMATGADKIFVIDDSEIPFEADGFVRPTISGSELAEQPINRPVKYESKIICPYNPTGELVDSNSNESVFEYLEERREDLESRSCVEPGDTDWYKWHEKPPIEDLTKPKLLFRDITDTPRFWIDEEGAAIPRHSVYYIIPSGDLDLATLASYLNTTEVEEWIKSECTIAYNSHYRLQSRVLRDLPAPEEFREVASY